MKARKLLKKLLSGSKNIRFDEFITLITAFNFSLDRITGSHHIFVHPNIAQSISIQPDKNGQAKGYQIKQFLKLIEQHQLELPGSDGEDEVEG